MLSAVSVINQPCYFLENITHKRLGYDDSYSDSEMRILNKYTKL